MPARGPLKNTFGLREKRKEKREKRKEKREKASAVSTLWYIHVSRVDHELGVTSHIAGNDRLRGFCLDVERTLFLVQADFSHGIGQDRVVPRVKTIGTCQK
jgi:hypothetical protein